jgi:hypothetical protein
MPLGIQYVSLDLPPCNAWLFPDSTSGGICNAGGEFASLRMECEIAVCTTFGGMEHIVCEYASPTFGSALLPANISLGNVDNVGGKIAPPTF